MPVPGSDSSDGSKVSYDTTRRGLVAAAAVLAAMLAAQKALAMARPPRHGRGGEGGRGRGRHECFLRGTRILTPKGEVKVEDLAVGDLVSTIDGTAKPIEWIGRRTYPSMTAEREKWPGEVLPIKVARSALGPLVPHTDLFLSPFHSIYIDGLLVPVRNLVNGRSIVHCRSVDSDTIEYLHVELAGHDVVFSEGAPTETLLAYQGYDEFDNLPDDRERSIDPHEPFAPRVPANRSAVLRSRLRSAVSPWIDRRKPGDTTWERLARRAEIRLAA